MYNVYLISTIFDVSLFYSLFYSFIILLLPAPPPAFLGGWAQEKWEESGYVLSRLEVNVHTL